MLLQRILIDPSGSKIEQAIAPSLRSTYKNRFPGIAVDREGGRCTEAALRKKQVIVPDVVSDTRWGSMDGARTHWHTD